MNVVRTIRSNSTWVVPAALLVVVNLFVLGPFDTYRNNIDEFAFGFASYARYILAMVAGGWILIALIGVLLPRRLSQLYASVLFAVGALLWIQQSFLVWDYGAFDGTDIEWGLLGWRPGLEMFVWVGVLAAAALYARSLARFLPFASWLLVGLELAAAGVQAVQTDGEFWNKLPEPPSVAKINSYSSELNILHIVLDAFQTDVFLELVEEENLYDEFEGFTVFRENMGVAPLTSLSIPAIFTGRLFDGTGSPADYFQNALSEGNFIDVLHDAGYTVNLMPYIKMSMVSATNAMSTKSIYGMSIEQKRWLNAVLLGEVGLFRQLPHRGKRWLFNDGDLRFSPWFAESPSARSFHQKALLTDYIDLIAVKSDAPAYHFLHFMPPHPPYVTLPDGSYAGEALPNTRENYKNEARYILRLVIELLAKLESMGLYDQALVIIQGDHGSIHAPILDGREYPMPIVRVPTLLAIKPPASNHPMSISHAQTSVSDIPATVMEVLTMSHPFEGTSVFEIDPGEDRTRRFVVYESHGGSEPTLGRFRVTGSIYDPDSWTEEEAVVLASTSNAYEWGGIVRFGIDGNAEPYKGEGWSAAMATGRQWTVGKRVELEFTVTPMHEDLVLELALAPYIVPGILDQQRIGIRYNDIVVTQLIAKAHKEAVVSIVLGKRFMGTDRVKITLELPDAVSPRDIGAGGDPRELGLSVSAVCMYPASEQAEKPRLLRKKESP